MFIVNVHVGGVKCGVIPFRWWKKIAFVFITINPRVVLIIFVANRQFYLLTRLSVTFAFRFKGLHRGPFQLVNRV